LSCGPKISKISGILDAISPALHPQKSTQHVRACAARDGAICSKNRKIVPYHKDSPDTTNGASLRSPSPIMAPDHDQTLCAEKFEISTLQRDDEHPRSVLNCIEWQGKALSL